MKRVALYYPWIHLRSGIERMILEVLARSRHQFTIFTSHLDLEHTFPEFGRLPNVVVRRRVSVRRTIAPALAAALTIARERLPLDDYDALIVSSEGLGDLITLRNARLPIICYCHSLSRPVFDAVYRSDLIARRPALRWLLPPFLPPYRALTRRAWRRYTHVFANSRTTRDQILANRLVPPEKVEVLHPGAAIEQAQASECYEPFFLYAGRIKWTKNVELAIEAFRRFKAGAGSETGWSLVIAGEVDDGSAEYVRRLQELPGGGERDGVIYQINPSRGELEQLMARCYALLYPSLSEPWGIVPVEAMALGRPVLAVNNGGPTESVADGETGFLLEPTPQAFAERMQWLAERPDEVRRLGHSGRQRARRYSWEAFVGRLDGYLDTLG